MYSDNKCCEYHVKYSYVNNNMCSSFLITNTKTRCLGTKNIEECTCNNDKTKCNFYIFNSEGKVIKSKLL